MGSPRQLWMLTRLIDILHRLDALKNVKGSFLNDFTHYKRLFSQLRNEVDRG